jgi:signal peptidase I
MKKWLNRIIMFLSVSLCILLLGLKAFGIFIICVKGDSMMPSIQDGQLFIATKIDPDEIRRGDIITTKLETGDGTKIAIKRVIGLPGEEICIGYSTIWIDGDWIKEDYLEYPGWNDFGKYDANFTLGPNEFYLMGDNRTESWAGTIKGKQITGRVIQ